MHTPTYPFKVSPISTQVLPNQSTTISSVRSTHAVHDSGDGGQSDCTTKGYKMTGRSEPGPTKPVSNIRKL